MASRSFAMSSIINAVLGRENEEAEGLEKSVCRYLDFGAMKVGLSTRR